MTNKLLSLLILFSLFLTAFISLEIVVKLLEESADNADIQAIMTDIMDVKASFDKVSLSTSQIETSVDEETNVTTLKSEASSNLTTEIFMELKEKIKTIRTKYIS